MTPLDRSTQSPTPSASRRDWLRGAIRWTLAAGLGLTTVSLGMKTLRDEADCLRGDACHACHGRRVCDKPPALAYRTGTASAPISGVSQQTD